MSCMLAVLMSPDTLNPTLQREGRRAQDMVRGLLLPALIIAGLLAAAAAVSWQLLYTFAGNLVLVRALSPVLAALLALLLCYQVCTVPCFPRTCWRTSCLGMKRLCDPCGACSHQFQALHVPHVSGHMSYVSPVIRR